MSYRAKPETRLCWCGCWSRPWNGFCRLTSWSATRHSMAMSWRPLMPSPFPGIDPYLEQPDVWHDFHQSFMPAVRASPRPQVSPAYIVKIEERIYIREPDAEEKHLIGHGYVTVSRSGSSAPRGGSTQLLPVPSRIVLPSV